jgi:putative hydroxymethylpyrimidine transport system substrate-binding protein
MIRSFILFVLCCFSMPLYAGTKPLTIMLDWELNVDHASLFVAKHYGFFAQQGLTVQLIPPADSTDPAKFAAIGKVDLALTYEPYWIVQQQQGLPLAWVSTLIGQPLMIMVANTKITTPSALRGLSVGYSGGGNTQKIFLKNFLQHDHLNIKEVTLVNVHYALVQALVSGRVMAITGAMRNVEPLELQQKHFPYRLFYPEDYGIPSFAELILVTRAGLQKDPRFNVFNNALQQAVAYLAANPEKTWQAFAQENPALHNETNHKMWLASIKYFYKTPGQFDQAQFDKFEKYYMRCQAML